MPTSGNNSVHEQRWPRRRWMAVLVWLALCISVTHAGDGPDYHISRYSAVFSLVPGDDGRLTDVRVHLEVTYEIAAGPKSEGFKYVGFRPVRDVSVTDGAGIPLGFDLSKDKEYRIGWHFPAVDQGRQTVLVDFTVAGAVVEDGEEREIRMDWVSNWRVPVFDASYLFQLPDLSGLEILRSQPHDGRIGENDSGPVFRVRMDRLNGKGALFRFTADRFRTERSLLATVIYAIGWVYEALGVMVLTIIGIFVLAGVGLGVLFVSSKIGGRGGPGPGGCSGGGCAGGCGGGGGGCGG